MTSSDSDLRLAGDLIKLAVTIDVQQTWLEAAYEAATHVVLVLGNNPQKKLKEILARPDVKEALTYPFKEAGLQTVAAMNETWKLVAPEADKTDLKLAIKSVRKNARQASSRMRKAVLLGPDKFPGEAEKIAKEYARRAQMSIDYVQKKAETMKAVNSGGTHKTWMGPQAQCSACQALHGTTIPIHALFDPQAGGLNLGTFGALVGPPRHPFCKCYLVVS